MIYFPLSELRSGMLLAEDVIVFYRTPIPLLTKGTQLTERLIARMRSFDVNGAYISDGVNDDIIPPAPVIPPEIHAEAAFRAKEFYTGIESLTSERVFQNIRQLDQAVSQLRHSLEKNTTALVDVTNLQAYDDCTYRHSLSVAVLAMAVGMELHLEKHTLQRLGLSAILHDIGKMAIPISVLNKPGKLTSEEFARVKTHAERGKEYLEKAGFNDEEILGGVCFHHERLDGEGYPLGLTDQKIPRFAKIISVVDIYDALTSHRPYRTPMQPSEAVEYLMGNCGSALELSFVQAFLRRVELYPVGCCVLLSDGRKAIVVNNANPLRPVVRLMDPPHQELELFSDQSLYNTVIHFFANDETSLNQLIEEEKRKSDTVK